MPKGTNDALVRRVRQLRSTLIEKHSKLAAQKVFALKKPTLKEIEEIIRIEFENSPV